MRDTARRLIVGLGNPGARYEQTRHNAGFVALDHFAGINDLAIRTEKMQGHFCSVTLSGKKVLLLKPMTYMNRSGECVFSFLKYFDIPPEGILVVHDDLDLQNGRIKMVSRGGAGGHNGIRSLIDQLGRQDFARLKIGIGHPRDSEDTRSIPVERYVLSPFSDAQRALFYDNLDRMAEAIRIFITEGIRPAMNMANQAPETSGPGQ